MKSLLRSFVIRLLFSASRIMLRRHNPTVVAITGSVGKTATKDAIAVVLEQAYTVRKSEKSFNSEIGVPLTILGLDTAWGSAWGWIRNVLTGYTRAFFSRDYPEVLVLEVGVDKPGDMKKITRLIKPNVVVLTRLPEIPVHVEHFASPLAVVVEKLTLVDALVSDGTFVCNVDDEQINDAVSGVRQRVVSYARYRQNADLHITDDRSMYYDDRVTGMQFKVLCENLEIPVTIESVVGMQLAYVHTAALAVAYAFGVDLDSAAKALRTHTPPPGRMRLLSGIKGSVLIDDTYNSSPVAVESALQTLNEVKYAKRKIAVLGDMLELGVYSIEQHQRMGSLAGKMSDILLTVGVRSREIAKAALDQGMSEKNIYQYDDVARAGRELQNLLQPGDVVLLKASQAIRLERVVEEVMQEPERAEELLCRQSIDWKQR